MPDWERSPPDSREEVMAELYNSRYFPSGRRTMSKIPIDVIPVMMRNVVAQQVSLAMSRYKGAFGDKTRLAEDVATVVALNCLEQFAQCINSQLSLIELDIEAQVKRYMFLVTEDDGFRYNPPD